MKNNVKHIVTSLIIIAFVLGFSIFAWLKPADDISLAERRALVQMPELNKNSLFSGSFTQNFEKYATDQFPLRDTFRAIKGWVNVNLFNRGENNGVYEYQGFLADIEYPVDEKSIDYAAERFNYVYRKYLKENDIKPYLAVIPHKGQFTAENKGYPNAEYDEIVDILKSGTPDFRYIDIKNTLTLDDYYRTDTHWRQEKIQDVSLLLGKEMGADVTAQYEEKTLPNGFNGVYSGQYALGVGSEKIHYLTNGNLEKCKVFDFENNKSISVYDMEKASGKDPYEMFLSGPLSLVTIENDNAKGDRELVIFRDSYGSALAPLMAEGYRKITLVDIRYMHPDTVGKYVDFKGADVLFIYSTSVLNNSETIK